MLDRRRFLTASSLGIASLACPQQTDAQRRVATTISVDNHGASVEGAPDRNLAAFRAALAATPAGGSLVVPAHGEGEYRLDTSGGLARALVVARPMTIVLRGRIRATHGRSRQNPDYLFAITAPDVMFTGDGRIAGPGLTDDTNLLDDRVHAGLIRVTGDRFRFMGPTIADVPKIGIHLWNCRGAFIGARWRGGIDRYVTGHTGLFGIRATGGGGHRIIGNRFERDERGRRLITAYFAGGLMGGTTGDELDDNVADVHEKLAYLQTTGSRIRNCTVIGGRQTDVVRLVGDRNLVENLRADGVKGGISIYNGRGNVIRRCVIKNIQQAGLAVSFLGRYEGGFADTIISDNILTAAAGSAALQDGILLYMNSNNGVGIRIENNRIEAAGRASWRNCIRVEVVPPYFAAGMAIRDNVISGGVHGLSHRRVSDARIERNAVSGLRGGEAILNITS